MSDEKKWFKYTIDYEYGMAVLLCRDRLEQPMATFHNLASECFGIRKSIGETKILDEELIPFTGSLHVDRVDGEHVMKMGMGDFTSTMLHALVNRDFDIDIPEDKLDRVKYILAHSGDVIAFSDATWGEYKDPWKVLSEGGDEWCTCAVEGVPEKSCPVHEFYVEEDES